MFWLARYPSQYIHFVNEFVSSPDDNFSAAIDNSNIAGASTLSDSYDVYRYGYNGKERDDDIDLDDYDYEARIDDARIGRLFSLDPQRRQLPHLSPYSYAVNSPLVIVDRDGELPIVPLLLKGATGAVVSAAMQYTLNFIIYQDSKRAFDEIDWGQVTLDGLSSALPWNPPGGKWGKAAISAAGTVALKALKGEYNQYSNAEEVFGAVAVDFIVSYLIDVGSTTAAEKLGKYALPKIASWLATKGISAKQIKSMTGIWSSQKLAEEAHVANYLESINKDVVEDIGVLTRVETPKGFKTQEIDVVTKTLNIEVKSGTTLKPAQLGELVKTSQEQGKKAVLFAPKLTVTQAKSLEKAYPGLHVVRYWAQLGKMVERLM